jgi:hypothetical protein
MTDKSEIGAAQELAAIAGGSKKLNCALGRDTKLLKSVY